MNGEERPPRLLPNGNPVFNLKSKSVTNVISVRLIVNNDHIRGGQIRPDPPMLLYRYSIGFEWGLSECWMDCWVAVAAEDPHYELWLWESVR